MVNKELILSAEGKCDNHRVDHSIRTMYFGRRVFELELANAPEEIRRNPDFFVQALDWAAVLHDREMSVTEKYDFDHGKKAANRVDEIIGEVASLEVKEMVKFLCVFHVPDDSEITGLSETQAWILKVFKDADSLDRVRFDNGDKLDESYLRFGSSRGLIEEAKELWERTKTMTEPEAVFDAIFENRVE